MIVTDMEFLGKVCEVLARLDRGAKKVLFGATKEGTSYKS